MATDRVFPGEELKVNIFLNSYVRDCPKVEEREFLRNTVHYRVTES